MDITSTKLAAVIGKTAFYALRRSYENRQEMRLVEFLKCIDLRYDSMTTEDQHKLNERINSEAGQNLLAEYADSITRTSSHRARMAMALLYCGDSDFIFDISEKITFVSAVKELNDDQIDFFLETLNLKVESEYLPYPRAGIGSKNIASFGGNKWDAESVFVNVNVLTRVRLLLPDPQTSGAIGGDNGEWMLWFGVTSRSRKFGALLRKAGAVVLKT